MRNQFIQQSKHFTLKKSLIGGAVVLVLGLTVYNMRDMLFGTPFRVNTYTDGTTLSESFVSLSGEAAHAKELSINGRPVAIDRSGAFDDGVILSPGYNVVEIALADRFGKVDTRTYHWYMEPPAAVAAAGVGLEPAPYVQTKQHEATTLASQATEDTSTASVSALESSAE